MLFENIAPFVRFATRQTLSSKNDVVNYDHRLYFALEGSATITLNSRPYHMTPNCLLIWHAGTVYSYAKDADAPSFEIASCNFDYTRCSEHIATPVPPCSTKSFSKSKILSEHVDFEDKKSFNDVIYIPDASILREPLLQLCQEYQRTTSFRRLKLNAIFFDVLYHLSRLAEIQSPSATLAEKVVLYLQNHFIESPSLQLLGNIFSYHPNYLNHIVLEQTGLSIHQHIIKLKFNRALELIMATNMSVMDIAASVGIADPQYFSRMFKKLYEVPPLRFRMKNVGIRSKDT